MNRKRTQRILGWILSVMMVLTVCSAAFTFETAAATAVPIKIEGVNRRFRDCADLLTLCNNYRTKKGLSAWTMDNDLMDQAMIRAAELAVYPNLTSPDGTSCIAGDDSRGQLISIDVFNLSTVVTNFGNNPEYQSTLEDPDYNAVGIGSVEIRNVRYVCVLPAQKATIKAVPSTKLTQATDEIVQEINVLPSILKGIGLNQTNLQTFYGGTTVDMRFMLTNSYGGKVRLTADCGTVSSSNEAAFAVVGGNMLKTQKKGKSTITLKLTSYNSISASVELQVISKSLNGAFIYPISDQKYTGAAIKPKVTVEDADCNVLVEGTDYEVSYSNNINVGTANVKVTGINAYYGEELTGSFKIIADPDLFKVTATTTASKITVGETAKISASIVGGTSPYTYKFESSLNNGAYSVIQAASTSSVCNLTAKAAGTYTVRVTATDKTGKTAVNTVTVTSIAALTSSIRLSSSQFVLGNVVTIYASASGGYAGYNYAYSVQLPNSQSFTTIKSYSTASTCNYTPAKIGNYLLRVQVKDSSGKVVESTAALLVNDNALKNTSAITSQSITLGTKLTLTGTATGGTAPYKFAFYYKKSSSSAWTKIGTEFGSAIKADFTPGAAVSYDAKVTVKDNTGKTVDKTFKITVIQNDTLVNNSTISAATVTVGSSVTIKGVGAGGQTPLKYAYYYKKSTSSTWTKIGTEFGTATSAVFTPGAAVTYNVKVVVKDGLNKTATKTFTVTSQAAPTLVNNSTISATSVTAGTSVTIKGAGSGGASPLKYAYYYKKSTSSTWNTIGTEFGTATSAIFTPAVAATYYAKVIIKDNAGATATKSFTVTSKAAASSLVNSSTISKTSVTAGTSVTMKGAASGGTAPYKYAYYYKKSTSSSWNTIGTEFGTAASAVFTPAVKATYNAKVVVKDSKGVTSTKTFTVTSTSAASTLVNASTISKTSVIAGTSVTMKGAASGGTAPYKYGYYYKKSTSSSWNTIGTEFGTATSAIFTPATKATYNAKVVVKDSTGATVTKTFTVTSTSAASTLVNNSTISKTSVAPGSSVTMKGAASDGTAPYTYAYYYKKSTSSSWNTIGTEFGTATSAIFTPAVKATYNAKVVVKDSTGTTVTKTFTVTCE